MLWKRDPQTIRACGMQYSPSSIWGIVTSGNNKQIMTQWDTAIGNVIHYDT